MRRGNGWDIEQTNLICGHCIAVLLIFEAQVEVSKATIRRAIGILNYHKYFAYQQGWQLSANQKNHVQYIEVILAQYLRPEDKDGIWFSNEVHFGLEL